MHYINLPFKQLLFVLLAFILLCFNDALAKCTTVIKFEQSSLRKLQQLYMKNYYQVDGFSAFQGLLFKNENLYATGGYSSSNGLRINKNEVKTVKLGKNGGDLIASVAYSDNKLAWTSHRGNKIIVTDTNLSIIKEILLKKSNLVGISFLDANNLVIINRNDPNGISTINIDNSKKVFFELKDVKDLYDIEVVGDCVYFSSRTLGTIYSISVKDLEEGRILKPKILLKDLQTPQHMAYSQGYLYVLEAATHKIIKINLISKAISKYQMNKKRSCRGLAVSNDIFFTSCFIDKPRLDEKRTAIFEWRLPNFN